MLSLLLMLTESINFNFLTITHASAMQPRATNEEFEDPESTYLLNPHLTCEAFLDRYQTTLKELQEHSKDFTFQDLNTITIGIFSNFLYHTLSFDFQKELYKRARGYDPSEKMIRLLKDPHISIIESINIILAYFLSFITEYTELIGNTNAEDAEEAKEFKTAFRDLQITNLSQMEQTLRDYGVISLRPFTKNKLIIGCGNVTPINRGIPSIDDYANDVYRSRHSHPDTDTIDPDIFRNPTIVWGFFISNAHVEKLKNKLGLQTNEELLARLKIFFPQNKYDTIILEGVNVLGVTPSFTMPNSDQAAELNMALIRHISKPDAEIFIDTGVGTLQKIQ